MALSPDNKAWLARIGGAGIARLIRFVARTSEQRFDPPDLQERLLAAHPAICACWHGQFMMLEETRPEGAKVAAMVARHGDAELIGEAMRRLDVELIRGAGAGDRKKDRGGAYALKAAMSALKKGYSIVMTADVPPGPARVTGDGIIALARLSGRPIVPMAAASSRYHALKTWSRMTIALPYSKLAYAIGEPIFVPRDADPDRLEALRLEVEKSLEDTTARAFRLAGADRERATPPGARAADAPPLSPGLGLRTYRFGTRILQGCAPLVLKYREGKGKEVAARRSERYGRSRIERPDGPLVWLHAASVGEMNAVLPVMEAMRQTRPGFRCLLTTATVTSAQLAQERTGPEVIHQFVPLDTPGFARDFIAHWRPDLAVFTESEIWPNLILETYAKGIPLTLINARMSKRSYLRWRKRPGLAGPLFNRFSLVLAQNAQFGRWFKELGARRVEVAGNLKIDAPPLPIDTGAYEKLAQAVTGRRGYIASSTHPGEDELIADAHRRIAAVYPGFLTIIAPRHPERGTAIAEMLKTKGLRVAQRSLHQLPTATSDVYVADTIGELGTLYELCPLSLIGGTLMDKGGQNPIEAVRHNAVVLAGPYRQNFKDIFEGIASHGAMRDVTGAEDLAKAVIDLLHDEPLLETLRARGRSALAEMAGALDLTVSRLVALMPSAAEVRERELDRAS